MQHTLLISLHPRHSQNILTGCKTIELRKKFPPNCKRVFFYETAPTKAIVGCFTVKETRILKAAEWCGFHRELQLTHDEITNYLKEKNGTGIFIENVKRTFSINLERMRNAGVCPPQNFIYLSDQIVQTLETINNGNLFRV